MYININGVVRGVAQPGRVLAWGARGRRFARLAGRLRPSQPRVTSARITDGASRRSDSGDGQGKLCTMFIF